MEPLLWSLLARITGDYNWEENRAFHEIPNILSDINATKKKNKICAKVSSCDRSHHLLKFHITFFHWKLQYFSFLNCKENYSNKSLERSSPAFCFKCPRAWDAKLCSSDFSETRMPIVWMWTCNCSFSALCSLNVRLSNSCLSWKEKIEGKTSGCSSVRYLWSQG